jgi:DNA-directed RNA polymerase III subunit RPC6|uniref:DNA-directed RNA polymerase III subunit RPC6 n=1 Tax=Micromonas pusilla TaxID=38833 RepID=A0A7R9T920_MICPS|tara:strand:- start:745 stop:1662 length:918 start_codon:yes stop_codon:yes gene_type:complete|mmetsp:Transcript_11258/g.40646  ORF Transcript_11258/g.40646 Transcript_11258/m.40646 type:complete len:306 (+) Transcript_11258:209-1126(+)
MAEAAILEQCRLHPQGIPDADLAMEIAHIPVNERASAINALLSSRKIQVYKDGDSLIYREVQKDEAVKFKGLSSEDLLVYQIIQSSGNTGIWTKELKQKSNLPQTQITKIFKVLEARKLIKSVKNVAQQNRKVYMLFELEPSREITGGAWYTEHEYDAEFISVLREQCDKFINSRGKATLDDVWDFVKRAKLSNVDLGKEEVLQIVNTLVYDGKIDAIEVPDPNFKPTAKKGKDIDAGHEGEDVDYMPGAFITEYSPAAIPIPSESALTNVPCGLCPVFEECVPGGLISPETCEYMDAWLAQDDP